MELRTHPSIRDLGEPIWRRLLPPDAPPFLAFEWLDALERTGCVKPERGWMPAHVSLRQDGRVVAAAPAYVKGNSEGEFVFDHGWARFAQGRLRIDYYPKLIVAVPFTPATGPRLLIAEGENRDQITRTFVEGIAQLCAELELSSAHVLFPDAEQASALARAGLARRAGMQFHWHNAGYSTFEDFLARFSSKRRNQIRRERRELERGGTTIEHLTGRELGADVLDQVFEFYCSTVHKYYWGRQYLNRHFFEEVFATMPERLHVVLARDRASRRPLAGAFNLLGKYALYGRYWGAREERACLHFNVCYYEGIDYCIRRGLSLFEPGAGGEHKQARGFVPTLTDSVHYLADPRLDFAVRDFVGHEREALDAHVSETVGALKRA
jgi:predicted N-acyltransferase